MRIERDIRLIRWMVAFNIAVSASMLLIAVFRL